MLPIVCIEKNLNTIVPVSQITQTALLFGAASINVQPDILYDHLMYADVCYCDELCFISVALPHDLNTEMLLDAFLKENRQLLYKTLLLNKVNWLERSFLWC